MIFRIKKPPFSSGTCHAQDSLFLNFRQGISTAAPSSAGLSGPELGGLRCGIQATGSLTLWLIPQAIQAWYYQGLPQRGSSYIYSDLAIQTALMMRLLYPLPLRQTEGFLRSPGRAPMPMPAG